MKKCRYCNLILDYSNFYKNEKYKDNYTNKCKKCFSNYAKNNRIRINKTKQKYRKKLRKTNELYVLKRRLSKRTWQAFQSKKWYKNSSNIEMLGCNFDFLKQYIESQFKEGMTWDNKYKWHIDHIIPLSSAKNQEELIKLCHYTNLQPLWAEDNLTKGSKII